MTYYSQPISHHGIQGQKWGIRRYQNPDGSLTAEGKKRYGADTATNRGLAVARGRMETREKIAKYAAPAAAAVLGAGLVADTLINGVFNGYPYGSERLVTAGATIATGVLAGIGGHYLNKYTSNIRKTNFDAREEEYMKGRSTVLSTTPFNNNNR